MDALNKSKIKARKEKPHKHLFKRGIGGLFMDTVWEANYDCECGQDFTIYCDREVYYTLPDEIIGKEAPSVLPDLPVERVMYRIKPPKERGITE